MKKKLRYLGLPVLALILEILPFGAVCNFARPATDGSIGRFRELYSYFDLTPFGYANFAPLLTALLTCLVVVLLAIGCIAQRPRACAAGKKVLGVAVVVSLGPLLLGMQYFSFVGALITLSLLAELILLSRAVKEARGAEDKDEA